MYICSQRDSGQPPSSMSRPGIAPHQTSLGVAPLMVSQHPEQSPSITYVVTDTRAAPVINVARSWLLTNIAWGSPPPHATSPEADSVINVHGHQYLGQAPSSAVPRAAAIINTWSSVPRAVPVINVCVSHTGSTAGLRNSPLDDVNIARSRLYHQRSFEQRNVPA